MTVAWTVGLLLRRTGRLVASAFGVAIAVALMASLGSFLAFSKASMTQRATSGVAVDWQVAVHPNVHGGTAAGVLKAVRSEPGTVFALPVSFADSSGFAATTGGSTQTTGPGKVLGLPNG